MTEEKPLWSIDSMDLTRGFTMPQFKWHVEKKLSEDAGMVIPDNIPVLKDGVPVGKVTSHRRDENGITVDFVIDSRKFKAAIETAKKSIGRRIHSSWPSDDLTDIGWAMARLALEYANEKWGMELYASVRVIEDEFLAIVNLYDPKTGENFGFACSNDTELLFDIRQEFEILAIPVVDLFAKKRGKKT